MEKAIINWLQNIEVKEGIPSSTTIAFNIGVFESEEGFTMYLVSSNVYSNIDDDWACIDPPIESYKYLVLPDNFQNKHWSEVLEICKNILIQLEKTGSLNKTLLKNAKFITTGFDDGELVKIR